MKKACRRLAPDLLPPPPLSLSGSRLVQLAIEEMVRCCAEEVVLEAEVNNFGALRLYANLGFIRDKRLHR